MIPADETFDGAWPYAPHFFDGNGFRQHDIDVNNAAGRAWNDNKRWKKD